MTVQATLRFLGTGGSLGTPMVGCHCEQCKSTNERDHRLRSSVTIQFNNKTILIDAGPDFRRQALKYHLDHLDGVIFTHAHNDHTAGIDDLRAYATKDNPPLPCLLSCETYQVIKKRFDYIFEKKSATLLPKFTLKFLEEEAGIVNFVGLKFNYISYIQANAKVNGFRCGNLAYCTDIKTYDNSIFDSLKNLDILIISALRHEDSPMHLSIKDAIALARKINAKKTYFTHIAHEAGHAITNVDLPKNMELAYDGLAIPFIAYLETV